jgi:hypothetical protein
MFTRKVEKMTMSQGNVHGLRSDAYLCIHSRSSIPHEFMSLEGAVVVLKMWLSVLMSQQFHPFPRNFTRIAAQPILRVFGYHLALTYTRTTPDPRDFIRDIHAMPSGLQHALGPYS